MVQTETLDLHETDGADRVREHTSTEVQAELDSELVARVRHYAERADDTDAAAVLDRRIAELEQETDVERALELNASVLALAGTVLGATISRRWLILSGVVTTFLFQHGLQGWCPPIPVLRRLGFRTRQEIDAERYALKLLRGDFDVAGEASTGDPEARAREALAAVTG